jgi:integration host factor subunit beta
MAGETITKRTIAERIAEHQGLTQGQTQQVVQGFLDEIVEELAKGNRLEFREFGVFETVTRKPRIALNPKTMEKVQVKSRVVVKFKAGRLLKEKVGRLVCKGRTKIRPRGGAKQGHPGGVVAVA